MFVTKNQFRQESLYRVMANIFECHMKMINLSTAIGHTFLQLIFSFSHFILIRLDGDGAKNVKHAQTVTKKDKLTSVLLSK